MEFVVVQGGVVISYPEELVEVIDLDDIEEDRDHFYTLSDEAQDYVEGEYPDYLPDEGEEED